ncbi:unnamed protein product [Arabidopsis halleri]
MDEESRGLTEMVTIFEEKEKEKEKEKERRDREMDLRMEGGTEEMYMKCVNRRDFEPDLEIKDPRFDF